MTQLSIIALGRSLRVVDTASSLSRSLAPVIDGASIRGWAMELEPVGANRLGSHLSAVHGGLGGAAPTVACGVTLTSSSSSGLVPTAVLDALATRWAHVWVVEPHVMMQGGAIGNSRRIYRLGIAASQSGMTPESFSAHWLQRHAPMVLAHGPLFDRYVVNIITAPKSSRWAGIVEQRFANSAVWAEHDRMLFEEKPEIRDDLRRFLGEMVQFLGSGRVPIAAGVHPGVTEKEMVHE